MAISGWQKKGNLAFLNFWGDWNVPSRRFCEFVIQHKYREHVVYDLMVAGF